MSQTVRHSLQTLIDQLTREILNATEKAWEAQKNKQLKQNTFWLDEKRKLTEERTELQKKLHQTPSDDSSIKPQTRQEIKEKIISLNKMAQSADKNMRSALDDKQLSQANTYLRQRNQFNSEVKHLNELLNPSAVTQKQKEKPKSLSREEIKSKIKEYNKKSLEADTKMRVSLRGKKLEKANELLQQRNYLNAEVKRMTALLSGSSLEKTEQVNKKIEKEKFTTDALINTDEKKISIADNKKAEDKKTNKKKNIAPVLNREKVKNRIFDCNKKAKKADKEMRIALSEKRLLKANDLLQKRNQFNAEAKELLQQLKSPKAKTTDQATQNVIATKKKILSRKELKNKLKDANRRALDADKAMRISLKEKQYQKANKLLKRRNEFNAEARKINLQLNPVISSTTSHSIAEIKEKKSITHSPEKTEGKLPQGLGFVEQEVIKTKKELKKQSIVGTSINLIDQSTVSFSTHIAEKTIAYRLGFIKFFYKRRELQQQIEVAKKSASEMSNNTHTLAVLNEKLKQHLQHPPKAYVEDHAHNELILHLLDKVDERGIAYFDFPEISASTIGAPLKQLRNQQDLNYFIQHYTEEEKDSGSGNRVLIKYFIRDIIQVKCSLTISDLILKDAIMDTATIEYGFVNLFDKIINKANQEVIRLQDESNDPLMPKVLRPIGRFDCVGHRDAIQLIPPMKSGIDQFSGAVLSNTTIQDNTIESKAKLQGIFSTDGAFKNLKIINNKISTEGAHKISILGFLTGEVTGNTDLNGKTLDIKIQPLRLGGGTPITNFFVLGFSKGCSYQYGHIKGISGTDLDRRSKKVVLGRGYDPRKYLLDFNMDRFIKLYQSNGKIQGRFEAIKDCVERMLKDGDAVKCNLASLEALERGASLKEAIKIAKSK